MKVLCDEDTMIKEGTFIIVKNEDKAEEVFQSFCHSKEKYTAIKDCPLKFNISNDIDKRCSENCVSFRESILYDVKSRNDFIISVPYCVNQFVVGIKKRLNVYIVDCYEGQGFGIETWGDCER